MPGEELTPRCLAFIGCEGGFRGGVELIEKFTTCQILKLASASNKLHSRVEVAALLDVGQQIVFSETGRYRTVRIVYRWLGEKLVKTAYTLEEWEAAHTPAVSGDEELL